MEVKETTYPWIPADCIDYFEDWKPTLTKKYCTLIWLEDVEKLKPFTVPRSNGTAWFVLDKPLN